MTILLRHSEQKPRFVFIDFADFYEVKSFQHKTDSNSFIFIV